jgi:hypothetical protein
MRKSLIVFVLGALAIAVSCDNKKGLLPPKPLPINSDACDSIRYTNAIKAIIDKECGSGAGCHAGPFPNAGVDLTTYSNVKAKADDGRIKARITDLNNPMPPSGKMPQARIDSVLCWIDRGAPL